MLFACFSNQNSVVAQKKVIRDTVRYNVNRTWLYSLVLPGAGQFRNKQYWKIPVVYASAGTFAYLGYSSNKNYHTAFDNYKYATDADQKSVFKSEYSKYRTQRDLFFAGVGAVYLFSQLDAVLNVHSEKHSPAKATIYSVLVPGLGQVYNRKYWKVPIVYAAAAGLAYGIQFNNKEYIRFKTAWENVENKVPDEFNGARSAEELKHYMSNYRRNRDLLVMLSGVAYALNIVDAAVDAHLYDYSVDDNLAIRLEPIITDTPGFGNSMYSYSNAGVGARLQITF